MEHATLEWEYQYYVQWKISVFDRIYEREKYIVDSRTRI